MENQLEQLAAQTFSLVPEIYQEAFTQAGAEFPDELVAQIKEDPEQAIALLENDSDLKEAVINIFSSNQEVIMEAAQNAAEQQAPLFRRGGKLAQGLLMYQQGGITRREAIDAAMRNYGYNDRATARLAYRNAKAGLRAQNPELRRSAIRQLAREQMMQNPNAIEAISAPSIMNAPITPMTPNVNPLAARLEAEANKVVPVAPKTKPIVKRVTPKKEAPLATREDYPYIFKPEPQEPRNWWKEANDQWRSITGQDKFDNDPLAQSIRSYPQVKAEKEAANRRAAEDFRNMNRSYSTREDAEFNTPGHSAPVTKPATKTTKPATVATAETHPYLFKPAVTTAETPSPWTRRTFMQEGGEAPSWYDYALTYLTPALGAANMIARYPQHVADQADRAWQAAKAAGNYLYDKAVEYAPYVRDVAAPYIASRVNPVLGVATAVNTVNRRAANKQSAKKKEKNQ